MGCNFSFSSSLELFPTISSFIVDHIFEREVSLKTFKKFYINFDCDARLQLHHHDLFEKARLNEIP